MQTRPIEYRELVTVHSGDYQDLIALRVALEDRGLETFLADDNVQTWHPLMFGGGFIGRELKAPIDRAPETIDAIRELTSRKETVDDDLEDLAARIRWAALMGFTAPFALWYGFRYLRDVRRIGKSRDHKLTLAALALAVPASLLLVAVLGSIVLPI